LGDVSRVGNAKKRGTRNRGKERDESGPGEVWEREHSYESEYASSNESKRKRRKQDEVLRETREKGIQMDEVEV
jgi:hypothetical protein